MRGRLPTLVALLAAGPALADGGVLEINQSCAVQTGCFSGDAAGFPVTISASGSYRLTGSLSVPDSNTTAIQSTAGTVTIDLNGFEIAGPTTCPGGGVGCTPGTGTGIGIDGTTGTWIKNGVVRGMGFRGVDVSSFSIVEDLQLFSNRAQQIIVGDGSIVRDNLVVRGGNIGIQTGDGVILSGNAVTDHNGQGAWLNGPGSLAFENSVYDNLGIGINAGSGSALFGNRSYSNGGDGIQTTSSALVQRNTIFENLGIGIDNASALAPVAYRNNTIYLNQGGPVDSGVDLGGNFCGFISPNFSPCE